MINMESHVFSCYLRVIAFAIGKIALTSLMQLPCLLLMQLFPNRTRIHVITHTNTLSWLSLTQNKEPGIFDTKTPILASYQSPLYAYIYSTALHCVKISLTQRIIVAGLGLAGGRYIIHD